MAWCTSTSTGTCFPMPDSTSVSTGPTPGPARRAPTCCPITRTCCSTSSAHFFKDRIRRSAGSLGQLADIAWVVHAHTPDWDVVVGRARAYGLHGRVYLSLMATNELLGPVVPAEVLTALRPASYSPAIGRAFVKRRLLTDAPWHLPGYFGGVPGEAFSRRWRPLRRVLPDRAYLEAAHGREAGPGSSYGRLLWVRCRRALTKLRPWHLYRDAQLNRWMRSVADEGTTRTPV